jgi:prepilin-type N-terminal cleavage/methylation domain-containing protein
MARRPGFTLVELLVSLALLAILAAALIPALASVRALALRVVCTSRLKDLTVACNMYRSEKHAYPLQPGTTAGTQVIVSTNPVDVPALTPSLVPPPAPTDMDASFLNVLQPYLRFPRVADKAEAGELPHVLQSPTVEDADDAARQSVIEFTFSKPWLYTGYAYCVRPKDNTLLPAVKLLKRKRVPSPRGEEGRLVIWADDVHWSSPDQAWSFSHAAPGAKRGPRPLTYFEPQGLLGQHRAFTDGSVEWVEGTEFDLDIHGKNGSAGDRASLSVSDLYFFWF